MNRVKYIVYSKQKCGTVKLSKFHYLPTQMKHFQLGISLYIPKNVVTNTCIGGTNVLIVLPQHLFQQLKTSQKHSC